MPGIFNYALVSLTFQLHFHFLALDHQDCYVVCAIPQPAQWVSIWSHCLLLAWNK